MDAVVAGQGYVGLPLAVHAAEIGHRVVDYNVDPDRIKRLTAGDSHVEEVASSRLGAVLDTGAYSATADAAALADFDITVITVPTPLRDGAPDLTYTESCAQTLGEHLRPGFAAPWPTRSTTSSPTAATKSARSNGFPTAKRPSCRSFLPSAPPSHPYRPHMPPSPTPHWTPSLTTITPGSDRIHRHG
ncbi:hypothetical protein [Streptomyces olivoreticuli]|uniref:hypothetical protein n=1 Tax=Streptomyces olivoreticuli TaxID=68246 RepID=UPI000E22C9B5|nr:hypothetical protein [Streptomyces olivoreticuli]